MYAYSLGSYGRMVADDIRTKAYAEALKREIKAGDVVADIGTGAGIFSLLACRFGAKRVYAFEPSGVIELAREIAAVNGFADRIEFISKKSTESSLPERVNTIVSDVRVGCCLSSIRVWFLSSMRERDSWLPADA